MLIRPESVDAIKGMREHEFPADETPSGVTEAEDDQLATLENCHKTISALEQELAKTQEARYEEGFASGEKAGYEKGIATIQAHVDKFVEVIENIRKQQETMLASSEKFVVEFALKVVEKILGSEQFSELEISQSKLAKIVEDALNLFADSTQYAIRVHPETAKVLEQHKSQILEQLPRPVALSIVDDPSFRPSDCLVESVHGVLDARIDSQLKEIKSAFKTKKQLGLSHGQARPTED